jgi:AcrR family transcriptional regulator
MTGRRASQKEQRRSAMLEAASRLFEAHGYARTTFEEIAAEAGVGVATVYKYFQSKQGIVKALLDPDVKLMTAQAQRIIDGPLGDPIESMLALLSAYRNLGGRNWASRELLKLTIFPGLANEGPLTEQVLESDYKTQAQIGALLKKLRDSGRLRRDLPVRDATAVIFALLNQHFGMYLSDSGSSFELMFRRLKRRVRLVFADWRP